MIAFKSCPRCRGDLHIGQEEITCLQCGYELRPLERAQLLARRSAPESRPLAKAA